LKYALKCIVIAGILLVVLGVIAVIFIYSGFYNIAATEHHWGIMTSIIETMRDRSIAVHSDDLQVPDFDELKRKEEAYPHYHAMCRNCHGAPGHEIDEFAEGLYPLPPGIQAGGIQKKRSAGEIYWIIKHGIKMTGMPAFGLNHDEEELWSLTALVKEMPKINEEKYKRMIENQNHNDHGYRHD